MERARHTARPQRCGARIGLIDVVLPHAQPGEVRREVRAPGGVAEGDRRRAPGARVPESHDRAPGDVRAPREPQGGGRVAPAVGSAVAARSGSEAEREPAGARRCGSAGETVVETRQVGDRNAGGPLQPTSLNSASLAGSGRHGRFRSLTTRPATSWASRSENGRTPD